MKNNNYSSYIPAYEDGTVCSETSAYKIQTPGNDPEESIEHSEHGESFKSYDLYIYSNIDRHPVTKTFIPLHYTSLHFTTLVENSLLPTCNNAFSS